MDEVKETKTAAPVKKDPAFSIERLRQDCFKLFGVTLSTFDGAMYGQSGEFTVEEARNIIKNWRGKEIKL